MEIKNVRDLQKKFKELDKKRFYRMILLLDYSLYKKDGSKTAFAKKYNINDYNDLYDFFKKVKENLKNDHEDQAFFDITEFLKSVIGRLSNYLYTQFQMDNKYFAQFSATVFSIRTIGFVLDNLKELQEVFKELASLKERENIDIAGEIEESQEIKLEKDNSEDIKEKSIFESSGKINLEKLLLMID